MTQRVVQVNYMNQNVSQEIDFTFLCMSNCKSVSHKVSVLQRCFVLSWENIYQHIWACIYTQCSLRCLDLCCFMGTSVCLNGQSLQGCMLFNCQHSYSGVTFRIFFSYGNTKLIYSSFSKPFCSYVLLDPAGSSVLCLERKPKWRNTALWVWMELWWSGILRYIHTHSTLTTSHSVFSPNVKLCFTVSQLYCSDCVDVIILQGLLIFCIFCD